LSNHIKPTELELRLPDTEHAPDNAPDQISTYFLDLEGLLGRVDSATTYYQVLAVDRTAEQEAIKSSFQRALHLLYPPYAVGRTIPAEINSRVERAFIKASQAFAVLASFSKRKEYDFALLSIAEKTIAPIEAKSRKTKNSQSEPSAGAQTSDSSAAPSPNNEIIINRLSHHGVAFRESSIESSDENRRRCERFKLSIPARVTGYDRKNGKWQEMTETIDVGRTGVRLRLRKRVKHGTVLFVTLPLPTKLRSHGFAEQSFNVYTLVRRVEPPKQGIRAVGVEFLGERPPAGFLEKPWAIFRAKRWGGNERRRQPREDRSEVVRIEYFDESMQSIRREQGKTENIGRYGLRVAGTTAPSEFDLIAVNFPRLKFEALAALRNRYLGKDGLERLCLQLIDKEFPLGVRSD
jgi:hypothetical protein